MCACLELWRGGSGKVGRKVCFQQNKWPAGLQGRLDLNTHFFFFLLVQLDLCCTISFEIPNAKTPPPFFSKRA